MQQRGYRPDPLREAYEAGQREARKHFRPVPQPEFMYVQDPIGNGQMRNSGNVSSKSIVINLPTVVTIVFFAITTTIGGALAWGSITTGIEHLGDKVATLGKRIERVELNQMQIVGFRSPKNKVPAQPELPRYYGLTVPQ